MVYIDMPSDVTRRSISYKGWCFKVFASVDYSEFILLQILGLAISHYQYYVSEL